MQGKNDGNVLFSGKFNSIDVNCGTSTGDNVNRINCAGEVAKSDILLDVFSPLSTDDNNKSSKKSGIEEFENYLFSEERLDASSPDLWPEQFPGITDFLARSSPINSELFQSDPLMGEKQETPEWLRELDQDDMNMLHGFGSLTTLELFDRVKELQDLSFQLGLEEASQMTRGRFLGVLSSENNPPSTSSGQIFNRD